ncbi:MAG: tRNA (N(6)-L-threonylcarbamoyladenosine(37)-C(2))-methylthiotransferase MtaB [Rickettsiales bacterium]|nr:tRNA (N(6)-L-threonylcarbamoyladenosine(37)-C(2))-methylthiotransferase MtaB [Rickettsiales bacterium]
MTAEENNNRVVTFGCRLNAYESEAIKQAVNQTHQNNLIVFNSCAVTSEAERQLRQAVRRARKENPNAKIVVTGCAAQIDPEKYAKMAEVDLVLGNLEKSDPASYFGVGENSILGTKIVAQKADTISHEQKHNHAEGHHSSAHNHNTTHQDKLFLDTKNQNANFLTPDETSKIKVNDIMAVKDAAPQLVSYFENKTRAFLEIQNGCNHRCTFCIIPFGRGNSRSVAFGEIAAQVKKMVAMGHKEVVLTGVDISEYGQDLTVPITLSQMIKRLLVLVPELPRLRLSSIDVAEIDDGILDLIANEPRFMPYLHLSVQSGDDMILKRMKRRHNRAQILEFCAKARQLRPEITFGADIIAGFPTETDEMFENSLSLIHEAGIIFMHIFPYSKRSGTPAAKMPQVNGAIIKKRAKILREAGDAELKKYLQLQVGKKIKVIVEKNNIAKSENFLDIRIISEKKLQAGEILEIKVLGTEENFLTTKI